MSTLSINPNAHTDRLQINKDHIGGCCEDAACIIKGRASFDGSGNLLVDYEITDKSGAALVPTALNIILTDRRGGTYATNATLAASGQITVPQTSIATEFTSFSNWDIFVTATNADGESCFMRIEVEPGKSFGFAYSANNPKVLPSASTSHLAGSPTLYVNTLSKGNAETTDFSSGSIVVTDGTNTRTFTLNNSLQVASAAGTLPPGLTESGTDPLTMLQRSATAQVGTISIVTTLTYANIGVITSTKFYIPQATVKVVEPIKEGGGCEVVLDATVAPSGKTFAFSNDTYQITATDGTTSKAITPVFDANGKATIDLRGTGIVCADI